MIPSIRSGVKNLIPRSLLIRDLPAVPGNRVLLTFDDGPDPDVTPGVLDRLKAFHARGVFFVVGRRAENHPGILGRILEEGHVLGNHTYTHKNDGDMPYRQYRRDVIRCQQVVEQATGQAPRLFRPPKGHLSLTSLTVPKLLGLKTINWTLGVRDWACRNREDALKAAQLLEARVAANQIVVLHDDNRHLLEILDYILPVLVDAGFNISDAVDSLSH